MKTYNFDYTYALAIDTVNEILQKNLAQSDLEVSYSIQTANSNLTLSGKLAPWSIATGGSNQLLRFNIPFMSGTLTVEGSVFGSFSCDLTGAIVRIEANLGWLGPGSSTTSQGNSNNTGLAFNFSVQQPSRDTGQCLRLPGHRFRWQTATSQRDPPEHYARSAGSE